MKILIRFSLIAMLCALGVWLWIVLHPGPEKIIRKHLMEIAHTASYTAKEGNLTRVAAAQKLAGYFSTDAQVVVDVPNREKVTLEGRNEIFQAIGRLRSVINAVKVEFLDLNLVLGPDKKTAEVELTAKITFPNERDFVPQELKFSFKELDGDWLITQVETVKVLK